MDSYNCRALILVSVCPQVAHMTKSEMHLHDLAFLGPGLLFLDQYFNSFIDEYLVLWIALVSTHTMLALDKNM